MNISARVTNSKGEHSVLLRTGEREHTMHISTRPDGTGSAVNGGELLFLALATCYCNDIFREAKKRGIHVRRVEVEVTGEFGAEGEPARNVSYRAKVAADAPREQVLELMRHTDGVAEIQNTLRAPLSVTLTHCETGEV